MSHLSLSSQPQASYVGIDISKNTLDAVVRTEGKNSVIFSHANDKRGIGAMIKQLKKVMPALIVIEPSGGYERALANALRDADAELPFALVNPRKARKFADAAGYLAKTDAVDAGMLAHFGEALKPEPCVMPDENAQKLAALRTRRQQLIELMTAEKNRAHQTHSAARSSIKAVIKCLLAQLCNVEQQLQAMIQADPVWLKRQRILVSIKGVSTKGVSTITAFALLASLPERGLLSAVVGQRDCSAGWLGTHQQRLG